MGLRLFLVVSMMALWFVTTPATGSACSCADPGTPSEAMAESALVFRGTATSISSPDEEGDLRVEFDVAAVWKGADASTIALSTHEQSAACGYPFEERVEYVVYSYDGASVGLCSRTAPVEYAGEDLATFADLEQADAGPGFPNSGSGGLVESHSTRDRSGAIAVVAATGVLLLGLVVLRLINGRHATANGPTNVDRT